MKIRIYGAGGGARLVTLSLAALVVAAAQIAAGATHPPEIENLVDQASSAPPELAAEALIRLAESDKVSDRAWKKELLEKAFRQGAMAQLHWKRVAVDAPHNPAAAFLNRVYAQNLDANSLQCRAVKALLPLDSKKARELFLEIPSPRLEPLSCADNLVYDVSLYYETLTQVANTAFTPKEVADDEPFNLVQRFAGAVSSPVQVGPVARMLATLGLKPQQRESLMLSLAGVLKDLSGDPRSFAAVTGFQSDTGLQIQKLVAVAKQEQSGAYPLIEGYRAFLVRNLAATNCGDTAAAGTSFGIVRNQPPPQDAVAFFNEHLRAATGVSGAEIKAITAEEIQPAKVETPQTPPSMCSTSECQQLASRYRALIMGPSGLALAPQEKDTTEWRGKLKEYMAALADWKEDDGDPAGYFRQKCALYSDLFNVLPKGSDRDELMRSLVVFLSRNPYQREHRAEWFLPVYSLIGRIFVDQIGLTQAMKELRNSEDPVISLFANLEQAVPRSPAAIVSLL